MTDLLISNSGLRNGDTITIRNVDVSAVGTIIDLSDTPSSYDNGKALFSTASGTEWGAIESMSVHGNEYHSPDFATYQQLVTASGYLQDQITGGVAVHDNTYHSEVYATTDYVIQAIVTLSGSIVLDHAGLENLDYDNSGHTGFASTTSLSTVSGLLDTRLDTIEAQDFVTEAEFTTYSGAIIAQIPTDFYTTSEVDSIITITSGTLQSQINALDDTYATDAELATVSGLLDSRLDAIEAQDFVTETEFTTYSGAIVAQFYSTSEVDNLISTVSGVINGDLESHTNDSTIHFTWATVSATIDHNTILNHHNLTTDIDHDQLTNFSADEHRVINDSGTSSTELWSAEKINAVTSGTGQSGSYSISSGVSSFTITFDNDFIDTNYDVVGILKNITDEAPAKYGYIITDTTTSGFTVELSDITDSANYKFNWRAGNVWGNGTTSTTILNFGAILTTNGSYRGDVMELVVDDASTVFGNVLYQAADFHYERADADSTSTSPAYVLALEDGSGTKSVLVRGQVCDTDWNWSAGKLYLSTTTGAMTQTKPSGSGDQIEVLGWALSADTIFFQPVTMVAEAV